jgi:hypothetical protein
MRYAVIVETTTAVVSTHEADTLATARKIAAKTRRKVARIFGSLECLCVEIAREEPEARERQVRASWIYRPARKKWEHFRD